VEYRAFDIDCPRGGREKRKRRDPFEGALLYFGIRRLGGMVTASSSKRKRLLTVQVPSGEYLRGQRKKRESNRHHKEILEAYKANDREGREDADDMEKRPRL